MDYGVFLGGSSAGSAVRDLVCIVCPVGCRLRAAPSAGQVLVEGHACDRGRAYAIAELTAPMRVLPTTVRVRNGFLPRLPVRTAGPIPKGELLRCMEAIRRLEVTAPVAIGEVIVEDLCGTGVPLVAARSMPAAE